MDVLLYATIAIANLIIIALSTNTEIKNFWMLGFMSLSLSILLTFNSLVIEKLGCTATACTYTAVENIGLAYFWSVIGLATTIITIINVVVTRNKQIIR